MGEEPDAKRARTGGAVLTIMVRELPSPCPPPPPPPPLPWPPPPIRLLPGRGVRTFCALGGASSPTPGGAGKGRGVGGGGGRGEVPLRRDMCEPDRCNRALGARGGLGEKERGWGWGGALGWWIPSV